MTAPSARVLSPVVTERQDIGTPALPGRAQVDVVIACHSPERPIARAVASVLDASSPLAAVTVVCHNLDAQDLAAVIAPQHRQQVRYLECRDGIHSPAGPFNAGLRYARAPWVSIMGSDDRLAPGAVRSWLDLARTAGAQFVMARLALGERSHTVPTPPVRPSRLLASSVARLPWARRAPVASAVACWAPTDLRADRMSYRSAPLGLLQVAALRAVGAELVPGARVGEDVALTTRLALELDTVYDAAGPPYIVGEDARDRVTFELLPIGQQLGFVEDLLGQDWFTALEEDERRAVAVKLLRIHVFGAVHYRDREEHWPPAERRRLAALCRMLHRAAPGYARVLSLVETDLLHACLQPTVPTAHMVRASRLRRRHGTLRTLLTADPAWLMAREAPVRLMAASVMTKFLPEVPFRAAPGPFRPSLPVTEPKEC